ncbi:Glycosyltransferase involved in cell wall bisynthesis [Butyrivibrio sp. ob235]|uniref:glycosyltransferase family 4 protein n=1 Tax=Butyrivibrio sp. ob235 TaxID=1761780 RepID=UPI0008CED15D|nr:glycosyltransferase family 4 protein [Butyrivibrio sp. ob235]SEL97304.1 Glycosyltransferase involved in cell wall bisynthesis [Butyrivibrio sp. ob235]
MHIVFVTPELATIDNASGGLATFTSNIARLFSQHGHFVEIILVTTKEEKIVFDKEIKLYNVNVKKSEWEVYDSISRSIAISEQETKEKRVFLTNIYKAHKVKELIQSIHRENEIDLIHFCNHGSYSLFMDRSIPYVIRVSGFMNILFHGADIVGGSVKYKDNELALRDKLEIMDMKKCGYIISPSYLLAEIAKDELSLDSTIIESPFILNSKSWKEDAYIELEDKNYILFYGTMRILKGIHVIANIAKGLLQKHKDLYIVLCGKDTILSKKSLNMHGDEEIQASKYVKSMAGNYADRVIVMGQLSREYLYPVINGAELVILPSRIENLSNACIESMALGKIVVGTNGASFEQLIENGVSGFLCERDNSDDFLSVIEKVLSLTEEEKISIIKAAKERIQELEPEKAYKRFLNYYNNVIEKWNNEA